MRKIIVKRIRERKKWEIYEKEKHKKEIKQREGEDF